MDEHGREDDNGHHYFVKVNGTWVCQICGQTR